VQSAGDPAAWTLEEAERVAARARGHAALAGAFPGVGGLERSRALETEQLAARRIDAVLADEVRRSPFGRCRTCSRTCPPWSEECNRCGGRVPAALGRRRPPGRRR
jgi:hypothetical protein